MPPFDQFREAARTTRSRFFTMDVAQRTNGDWLIMELGDGQVVGLPDHADRGMFVRTLTENDVSQR